MSRGGGDRSWLTPIRPDGTRWDDEAGTRVLGTHTGFSKALNITGARPGMSYAYVNSDPRERWIARGKGYEEIQPGDPDVPAYMVGMSEDTDAPTPLDTSGVYQDLVPVRIPTYKLQERLEANDKASAAQLRNADAGFLQGATEGELSYGSTQGQPTRYALRNHATQLTVGDEVVEQWASSADAAQRERGITQD